MNICKRCYISGRVQGVAFRYYTQQEAQKLGITGFANNLTDGRVEVLAYGKSDSVNKLCWWLHKGSPSAHVIEVKCKIETDFNIPNSFRIG